MDELVIRIGARASVEDVGGKAAVLCELTSSGFPVPEAVVVSVAALELHLAANLCQAPAPVLGQAAERLAGRRTADLILGGRMPTDLRSAILSAARDLDVVRFAVRSSALGEDGLRSSFAGQLRSFLNVPLGSPLLNAVKHCWASLFEARVRTYAGLRDASPPTTMGVIVQRMVNADVSGVVFTEHFADRSLLLIEASYGLGDAVVGGLVSPDQFSVNRKTFAIEEQTVGEKRSRSDAKAAGGVRSSQVPVSERIVPCLSAVEAMEVARLCLRIEELLGSPQDVEWCKEGRHVWVLQARPITTHREA